jgi:thiamine kinase-like enzyme
MIKDILKNGKISILVPKNKGALSGEVHLVEYQGKKYVLRRCVSSKKAKFYEEYYKKFRKYGFFPKLLGRVRNDVLFEYIEGKDLRENEPARIFYQIGRIAARINHIKVKGDMDLRFNTQLEELVTGKFRFNSKIFARKNKLGRWKKPKAIMTWQQANEIKEVYDYLRKKAGPIMALDANDITDGNFRLGDNGKVYFVDIEAIKPRARGFGIAKFFMQWGKKKERQQYFEKGYNSVSPMNFFKKEYADFCFLSFLMQRINYKVNLFQKQDYKEDIKRLNVIVNRYKDLI